MTKGARNALSTRFLYKDGTQDNAFNRVPDHSIPVVRGGKRIIGWSIQS